MIQVEEDREITSRKISKTLRNQTHLEEETKIICTPESEDIGEWRPKSKIVEDFPIQGQKYIWIFRKQKSTQTSKYKMTNIKPHHS